MTVGKRIKQRRIELGLTQTELAHRLGLKSKVSISTVENDKEDLTTDRIQKYADALETTAAALMGWEETTTFRRFNHFTHVIDENGKDYWKATPTEVPEKMKELEELYIRGEIIRQYTNMLNKPVIQKLLIAAKDCSDSQIQIAINVLEAFKTPGEIPSIYDNERPNNMN